MVNKIIDGICLKLKEEFGDDYKIYTEEVKQGLKTPCFFINVLNPSQELFHNNRYYLTNMFCIQYITDSKEPKDECNRIRDRLFNCLEYININEPVDKENFVTSLIRGKKMHGEYDDDILNFFVNYDMFVIKTEAEINKIESCDYNSEVTEGD